MLTLSRAFLRSPKKYPDPENFRPERWLEPGWPTYQEPVTQFPTIKGMSSFGWGQRQCLGMTLTQDELVVACGALAWCFNMKQKVDPTTGHNMPVPLDKSNSLLIIKPDPFQMAFEPRSDEKKKEALRLWAESEARDLKERADFLAQAAAVTEKTEIEVKATVELVDEKAARKPQVVASEKPEKVSHWVKVVETNHASLMD